MQHSGVQKERALMGGDEAWNRMLDSFRIGEIKKAKEHLLKAIEDEDVFQEIWLIKVGIKDSTTETMLGWIGPKEDELEAYKDGLNFQDLQDLQNLQNMLSSIRGDFVKKKKEEDKKKEADGSLSKKESDDTDKFNNPFEQKQLIFNPKFDGMNDSINFVNDEENASVQKKNGYVQINLNPD